MTIGKQLAMRAFSPFARRLTQRLPRVLMYHRFAHGRAWRRLSGELFERQLSYLNRHLEPCRLDGIVERLKKGARLPDAPVAITVDDGYADFYEVAYPILKRYGIPATVFVVTRFTDQAMWLWFDALHYLVTRARAGRFQIEIAGGNIEVALGSVAARETAWEILADACAPLSASERKAVMRSLEDVLCIELPPVPTDEYRAMTWDEVRQLDPFLIEVGAQTCTHQTLSQSSPAELEFELTASKATIERELGRSVRSFCYPGGQPRDYNGEVARAVGRAGYEYAVVAHGTLLRPGASLLTLERMGASDELLMFQNTMDGYEYLLERAKLRLRRARGIPAFIDVEL